MIVEVKPIERIGQHWLVDADIARALCYGVDHTTRVIEIGAGTGVLTKILAGEAREVVTIEIDERLRPYLDTLANQHPNLNVIFGNGLDLRAYEGLDHPESKEEKWVLVSNLPFHISEPFVKLLPKLPIRRAQLMMGDEMARVIALSSTSSEIAASTVYSRSFFDIYEGRRVPRSASEPTPRTDARLMFLERRECASLDDRILRIALLRDNTPITLRRAISIALEEEQISSSKLKGKMESNRRERRMTRELLKQYTGPHSKTHNYQPNSQEFSVRGKLQQLAVPEEILHKPFNQYSSQELRVVLQSLELPW